LRIARLGNQDGKWTRSQISAGLQKFYEVYGRYPTSREIDAFEYLPSARSIQRKYGGLISIRKELIPESHADYTKGAYRSAKAKESWHRAAKYEEEFYNFLLEHFDPVAVHEHKIMRPGNIASDFYIYTSESDGVVIDLFYAQDLFSLSSIVSIKLKRYVGLPYRIIFVLVGNQTITAQRIQKLMLNRISSLPKNISIDTEANFKSATIFAIKRNSKYSI